MVFQSLEPALRAFSRSAKINGNFARFREMMDLALTDYSMWKGMALPKECSYDTVGNIQSWGEGGKECKQKCKVEVTESARAHSYI